MDAHEPLTKSRAGPSNSQLSYPPPPPEGSSVITVDFRLTIFHVSHVNTRDLTAHVKFGVVLYWTDPRLIGFKGPFLPAELWGPDLDLRNAQGHVEKTFEQFAVLDASEGRLKRIINYEASIVVPMDLSSFPYDVQSICPELVSISHWSQCAGSRSGSLAKGQSYALRPVTRPEEGKLVWMMWDGRIAEWNLHSWAIEKTTNQHVAGFTLTLIKVSLHVSRKFGFYEMKVLLPLMLLTMGSFLLTLDEASNIGDRMNLVFTMFLAAFALQYVISDHLPRIDFMTVIDQAVLLTDLTLLWLGLESWIVFHLTNTMQAPEYASVVDEGLGMVSILIYLVSMVWLFLPKRLAVQAQIEELYNHYGGSEPSVNGDNTFSSGLAANTRSDTQLSRLGSSVNAVSKMVSGVGAFRDTLDAAGSRFERLNDSASVDPGNRTSTAFADGTEPVEQDARQLHA